MGEVLLAEQVSMERNVAVKRLKREARNDYSTLKLLQEAWVTGYLEHPNVIPVYDITVDAQGSPLILLKRIHGVAWGELMDDPETVRERWGAATCWSGTCACSCRCATRCTSRTGAASCTATSSPRT
jgi:serine/threonine protein kinase